MRIRSQLTACASVCAASVVALVAGLRFTGGAEAEAPDLAWLPQLPASAERPEIVRVSPFGQGPARFEPNHGQAPAATRFVRRGSHDLVHLTADGFTTVVRGRHHMPMRDAEADVPHGVRVSFSGGAADPVTTAEDPIDCRTNYFVGRDPEDWIRDVPNFARVRYSQVWPGIDVVFHGRDGRMQYDFLLSAGADPDAIVLAVEGSEGMRIDAQGDLVLDAGPVAIRHRRPVVWQEAHDGRRPLACAFEIDGADRVRFRITGRDAALPTVIDPTIDIARRVSGDASDTVVAVAGGTDGSAYCAGTTLSTNFIDVGSILGAPTAAGDAFVCRFPPDAATSTAPVAFSFLGGGGTDGSTDMIRAPDGSVFLTLFTTDAATLPRVGGEDDPTLGGVDVGVVNLSPDLSTLRLSFPFGTSSRDLCTSLQVLPNPEGNATQSLFAGVLTDATSFDGLPTLPSGTSSVVVRFDAQGMFGAAHHIGTSSVTNFAPVALALDDANQSLYCAATGSPNGFQPLPGAYQATTTAFFAGFVQRVELDFSQVHAATYFAGSFEAPILCLSNVSGGGVACGGFYSTGTLQTTSNAAFPAASTTGLRGFYASMPRNLSMVHTVTNVGGSAGRTTLADLLVLGTAESPVAILGCNSNSLNALGGGRPYHGVLNTGPDDLVLCEIPGLGGLPFRISCEGGTDSESFFSSTVSSQGVEFGRRLAVAGGKILFGASTLGDVGETPDFTGISLGGRDALVGTATSTAITDETALGRNLQVQIVNGQLTILPNPSPRNRFSGVFTLLGEDGGSPGLTIARNQTLNLSVHAPTSTSSLGTLFEIQAPLTDAKITNGGKVAVVRGTEDNGAKYTVTIDTRKKAVKVTTVVSNIPGMTEPVGTPLAGAPVVVEINIDGDGGRTVCSSGKPKRGTRRLTRRLVRFFSRFVVTPKTVTLGQPNTATTFLENTGTEPKRVRVVIKHKGFTLFDQEVVIPGVDPETFLAGVAEAVTLGTTPSKGKQQWTVTIDGKKAGAQTTTTR